MTLCTKPEVYNISHCHQTKTKPRPQVTCTETLVECERVRYASGHTTRQSNRKNRYTDHLITILCIPTCDKVKIPGYAPVFGPQVP